MEAVNLAEWLLKKIHQREQDILESLGGGNIQSIEDYRFHIGELTALRSLEAEIKEVLQTEE
ncbi:MAG TPA: hypothetical protein DIV44_10290 [Leeuwenhoekiella sp.]|jgi:hypothetical protein|nr:hypothetical protein [Candidatus Neomarinimicrobiota bacterium]MBO03074.1 hypothetical protein [Candidatus Neomarinimicrobiota bacterium]HCQ77186.1 hypothetical protein [Leeuwenhoekiella sp.]|tara:strand:+ start:2966 stop:3151 length:186 start_codon:yes stop_codon:yes gene_type:complete